MATGTCCDNGRVGADHFWSPPPYEWTDAFGRTYKLCPLHYRALVDGLRRAEEKRAERTRVKTPKQELIEQVRRILSAEVPDGAGDAGAPAGEAGGDGRP